MSALHDRARGVAARVKQGLAGSAWTPLAGKGAAYLLGFSLLALVGSGRAARWISPAPSLGIAVAEAATAPPAPRRRAPPPAERARGRPERRRWPRAGPTAGRLPPTPTRARARRAGWPPTAR